MRQWQKRLPVVLFSLSWCLGLFGCMPPSYRTHPELESRMQGIKEASLPPPDVRIYEVSAGGMRELMDDWSVQGQTNIFNAIPGHFPGRFQIRKISVDKDVEDELKEVVALYNAVSSSILLHTYMEQHVFPEKKNYFDYSVGSIDSLLKKTGADALLIINGHDEVSTGGRKAVMALAVITGAAVGVQVYPQFGVTRVNMALIDRSGAVLWYNIKGAAGGSDLRSPQSTESLIRALLADFPGTKR